MIGSELVSIFDFEVDLDSSRITIYILDIQSDAFLLSQ